MLDDGVKAVAANRWRHLVSAWGRNMEEIVITCATKSTSYWLAFDRTDLKRAEKVVFNRKKGLYYLTWWMVGPPGTAIKIDVSVSGKKGPSVDTKVPDCDDKAAGTLRVEVQ